MRKALKIAMTIAAMLMTCRSTFAQSYDTENKALRDFIVRMYKAEPFDGVWIVEDYEDAYLVSVVFVKKNSSESAMNRVAEVKSQRQTSQFLGATVKIDSETIIKVAEDVTSGKVTEEVIDSIREHSVGFTKAMQILTKFEKNSGEMCYIYFRKLEEME